MRYRPTVGDSDVTDSSVGSQAVNMKRVTPLGLGRERDLSLTAVLPFAVLRTREILHAERIPVDLHSERSPEFMIDDLYPLCFTIHRIRVLFRCVSPNYRVYPKSSVVVSDRRSLPQTVGSGSEP